ncbi:MAG: endopeptidase La [Bacilli bacterium]|nr:endopeptidase La [Bacilli bacterium]
MDYILPVLLLKDLVLLPNQEIKIELDNDFSKKALAKSLKEYNGKILFVCPKDPMEEEPDEDDLPNVGVIGKVKSKIELPNGMIAITVRGLKRIVVDKYVALEDNKNILFSKLIEVELPKYDEIEVSAKTKKLLQVLNQYIKSSSDISNSILNSINGINDINLLTDVITNFIPLSFDKKLEYMQEINAINRANKLIKDINVELEVIALDDKLNDTVFDEMEQNQKDYIIKEKMRQLKKELGEEDNFKENEINGYFEKLEKLKLNNKTRQRFYNEIKKYEFTSDISPESTIIYNYLDWVLNLPWRSFSKDEKNISKIRHRLDKTHYGLDSIKDRIVEYVSVKLRNPSVKSPIICLVGPSGVGKTSLASAIAKSLNKKFYKISVGGLNDVSELLGHRKTYIGASPGKIIQGLKKCGTSNPIFLIDEVDKMVKDYHGDPASALLDILDPEQNNMFVDNYIEEPIDLSHIFFILTANDKENIPPALLDRLEIIELSSYTIFEKTFIAKKYLIPKIYRDFLIEKNNLTIRDDAITKIINDYTKEAGVRELERTLRRIIRKVVTANELDKKDRKLIIKASDLNKYLGIEKFASNENEIFLEPGVTNGLAYTPIGGSAMLIETCVYPGNGEITLTGNLGKVLEESIKVALSYIKSHFKEFNIKKDFFDNVNIHIHFAEGAIKKDGPSAGITITTTLISLALGRVVPNTIAMTGEISLKGKVMKVGGLKEKLIGANNAHIKKVFIPASNHADLQDVPEEIKKEIEIIEVNNYIEIFNEIFNK